MSSESFGMKVVDLAGAPMDASADQIDSLANTARVAGGDIIKGYDTAQFNQAIQEGDKYLMQMADELNVPPEVIDQIKVFTGSPEATKAGANYLMKWHQANNQKSEFEYGMGLVSNFDDQFKKYSEERLMGLDSSASKEERDALAESLRRERERGLEGLRGEAKTEQELQGLERMLGQGKDDNSLALANLAYKNRMADLAERRAEESEKRGEFDRGEGFEFSKKKYTDKQADAGLKLAKLSDKDGALEIMANTESLIGSIEDAIVAETKSGQSIDLSSLPGFNPYSSTDFLDANSPIKRGLVELGVADDVYANKSANLRAAIGRYLDQYKKFISGTAVSDDEYKKLMNNLGAGTFNTFPQFINALKNMVDKDLMIYNKRWKLGNTRSDDILSEKYSDFNISNSMTEFSDFLSSLEGRLDKAAATKMDTKEVNNWMKQYGLDKFFTDEQKKKLIEENTNKIKTPVVDVDKRDTNPPSDEDLEKELLGIR